MKLSTHNILMCNKKSCRDNEKNYPLKIKATEIKTVKNEFDIEKAKKMFERLDKKGLNQGLNDLNMSKYNLENLTEDILNSKEFWEYIFTVLFETEIENGNLVCNNCGREYIIQKGIPDMVLKDEEL